MKKEKIAPVCELEIVDETKVNAAREKLENNEHISDLADFFKLLGEPTRLKIVFALLNNELCVCDLAAAMQSNISTVSHQLRLLRNARLIKYRKEGKMVFYSLDDDHIVNLITLTQEHVNE